MVSRWIIILQIAIAAIVWSGNTRSQERENHSIDSNQTTSSKNSDEWGIPVRVLSAPSDPKVYSTTTEDYKKQEARDEENLEAQRSIANSSHEISLYTYQQLLLGVFAAFFSAATLVTAIAAALYARKSAHAAHKSVDITRKFSEAQTRAYVYVKEAAINWFSDGAQVILTIVNCGTTPAKYFSVHGTMDFQENGAPVEIPSPVKTVTWSSLGSGEPKLVPIDIEHIHHHMLKRDQTNYLSVRGTIIYTTIFDEVFQSQYSFMMRYNASDRKKLFNAASKLKVFELEGDKAETTAPSL